MSCSCRLSVLPGLLHRRGRISFDRCYVTKDGNEFVFIRDTLPICHETTSHDTSPIIELVIVEASVALNPLARDVLRVLL